MLERRRKGTQKKSVGGQVRGGSKIMDITDLEGEPDKPARQVLADTIL